MTKEFTESGTKPKLTRGTKKLVEDAIQQLEPMNRNNSHAICAKMTDILVAKFKGDNLDYQTGRMGLETTGKILEKIEEYFQTSKGKHLQDEVLLEQKMLSKQQ